MSSDKSNFIPPPKTRTRDQLPEQPTSHIQKECNDDTIDKSEDEAEDSSSVQPRRSTRQRNKPPALNMNPNMKSYADFLTYMASFNSDSVDMNDCYDLDNLHPCHGSHHYAFASKKTKSDPDIFTWDETMSTDERKD